ncbi:MAG TPA: L-2-hydroxyglutarate oxidase [Fimbriimonas sp.]|nr:L-2-hydroxyglutarate oxidase [Fimbriimonas sp.]
MESDVVIVGGGILGLATAFRLSERHPSLRLAIVEKEAKLAAHQTGRNSGVIHSGIYYKPGSLKARTCRGGKASLQAFCRTHQIPFETCGKVVVAVNASEIERLHALYERGGDNAVRCRLVDQGELKELEPNASGVEAIHVADTGIVDYPAFCQKLAEILQERGHQIELSTTVTAVRVHEDRVTLETTREPITARFLINCAGLYSDRIARMEGLTPEAKIVPFRGEYFELRPSAHRLCRNLIYPVPDPQFPFLGVHFTRMIHGGVECGPNAVLAFAREGYGKLQVNLPELTETLSYAGFRRLAVAHWRMGLGEMWRSLSKAAFVRALQRLVPEIKTEDLTPVEPGVRAQAVRPDGGFVDDFSFAESERSVHVVNAPSPAATGCLAIGDQIVDRLQTRF